ncbi:extracellular solute-binding protein [Anaerocolumna sp. MB42-C2]|uniref:extracellular solute-binding protein n=1 Tax=Anaerocolumna sp. MB42-C2 TaxID=3070997 RepID=UPI0027E2110C|nr:extracellular solute-binding protein [Anaerocolumna sp. MB42-C2]WMJ87156.1 extracellular solute-binding protein [Anaerocolumna sp. MB42-C2]
MKSRILKRLVVFTVCFTMIGSLTACSEKNVNTSNNNTGNTADSVENTDPFGAYEETLNLNIGRQTATNPKLPEGDTYDNNPYTRYVKNRLNIQITDEFEANGDDYDRQVSLAIASGELPDVMKVNDRKTLYELVENDLIADLTDVYQKYASDNIKKIYDSYEGRVLNSVTDDGKLMALPSPNTSIDLSEVWVRQDWVEKLGMTVDPDGDGCISIDELHDIAKTFYQADPENTGDPVGLAFAYYLNGSVEYCMTGIANAMGAYPRTYLKNENGNVIYGSNTEEMKASLGILADWFKEGLIDPQFGTRTWDDISALLNNGQTGIAFGHWHIPDWGLINVKAMNPKAEFKSYAISDKDGNANVTRCDELGSMIVVSKACKHPEAAIKIANLMYDEIPFSKNLQKEAPEVYDAMIAGIDGSTRPFNMEIMSATNLVDDYNDIVNCVEGKITLDEVRTLESKTIVGNIQNYNKDPNNVQPNDWAKYTSRLSGLGLINNLTNSGKLKYIEPAFFGNTDNMEATGANLVKLEEESFIKIVTGAEPSDYFETYVSEWMKQGGEKNIQEIETEIAK